MSRSTIKFLLMLFLTVKCFSQDQNFQLEINSWKYFVGDNAHYALTDFDDSSWQTISLPQKLSPGKPDQMFWLRTEYTFPSNIPKKLWFQAFTGTSFEIYINGEYVGTHGKIAPFSDVRNMYIDTFLIPGMFCNPGETIEIALKCSMHRSSILLRTYTIVGEKANDYALKVNNFLNGRLFGMLASVCFFLAFYCFSQFLFQRNDKTNLFFSIMMIFVFFYLGELSSSNWVFVKYSWIRGVARGSILASMILLPPFLQTFFNMENKIVTRISISILVIYFLVNMIVSGDDSKLEIVFTFGNIFLLASVIYGIIICVQAFKKSEKTALVPLICLILGVICAVHDVIFDMQHKIPLIWLQVVSIALLNFSIFFVMAIRQARIKQENALSTQKIENQKVILENSFSNIREVIEHLTEMGLELNNSTELALKSAGISSEKGLDISKKAEKQYKETEDADKLVNNFMNSISNINENLTKQTEHISRTAASCTELSESTEIITKNIKETLNFTNTLADLTKDGEKSAVNLDSAMQEIAASSNAISNVINVVDDFSERTNVLAMNAAIEAARAGLVGRGFAIIANEIKTLSSQQKSQVGQIRIIIGDITQKIQEGANHSEKVRTSLMQITEGTQNSVEQIKQIAQESVEQAQNTVSINESMENLAKDSVEIQKQLKNQSEYSDKVRKSVAVIADESNEVMQSTHDIIDNNGTLTHSMQALKQHVSNSAQLIEKLLEGTKSI